jgi:Xaa-Pro aminopeptidase
MKQIRHSKFKNTGFLFELLVRQITSEVLGGKQKSNAEKILKEFFSSKKELSKELKLYQYLINERYNSEIKAERFLDTVCEARKRLDAQKLLKEKYNLIRAIREAYTIDEFVKSPISNYKVIASIYKLFEVTTSDIQFEPSDIVKSRFTIVENIINSSINNKDKKLNNRIMEEYKKQDEEIRLLSYRILVENFNKKYSNLSTEQKTLLKQYINNMNNNGQLREYIIQQVDGVLASLKEFQSKIKDEVTKIKLAETVNNLKKIKSTKVIREHHLSAMMITYELLKEFKNIINR